MKNMHFVNVKGFAMKSRDTSDGTVLSANLYRHCYK